NIHDVLDDRIDVTTRGFLGLTASCARCHDHKYDPIPTADYYSLYGVFASSEAPLELPVIGAAADERAGQEFLGKVKTQIQEIRQFLETQYSQESRRAGERVPDYLVRAATEKPDPLETAIFFLSLAPEDLRPQIVHRWRLLLAQRARPEDPVFGPWTDWMALPDGEMRERTPALLARWAARPVGTQPGQLNPLVLEALGAARPSNRAAVARAYGSLLARVYADGQVPNPVLRPEARQLLELVTGPQSPSYFRKDQTWHYMSRGEKDSYAGKLVALDKMAVNAAHPPPRAMVLQDSPELYEPRVFLRGSPSQPGPAVPRQFLAVASSGQREPFRRGSGRLELAEAIGHPDNPLTARVLVNRIWMHHFGEPLVANPGDFGTRSAPPTHPALLDWLASWFVGRIPAAGEQPFTWKRLHRLLVLSSTYRQQSADRPAARSRDPENRLLWRANRRRLELEAMRDGMLAVADRLDRTQGGRPADLAGDPENRRRTLYGVVDRQSLPGLYRAFDFASPDQSAERRPRTTTPQQALFALNNPFVLRQARALAALPEVAAGSPDERITALYRRIFARAPEPAEREGALRFLAAAAGLGRAGERKLDPVSQLAQVLLLTNEFLFVD
ncbi:MAG: DUF1553 domain-containing protein, partial [Armatimonadetes bacterium]|nr:DUF1553 domain-containing protein [Armatimonadota bacterium]